MWTSHQLVIGLDICLVIVLVFVDVVKWNFQFVGFVEYWLALLFNYEF